MGWIFLMIFQPDVCLQTAFLSKSEKLLVRDCDTDLGVTRPSCILFLIWLQVCSMVSAHRTLVSMLGLFLICLWSYVSHEITSSTTPATLCSNVNSDNENKGNGEAGICTQWAELVFRMSTNRLRTRSGSFDHRFLWSYFPSCFPSCFLRQRKVRFLGL